MNKLSECKSKDLFSVKYIEGTIEQKKHLQDMGFVPLTVINVISVNNDNMIVQVFNSRIAINNEISNNIYGTILKRNKQKRLSKFMKR